MVCGHNDLEPKALIWSHAIHYKDGVRECYQISEGSLEIEGVDEGDDEGDRNKSRA